MRVSENPGLQIRRARMAKGMSQEELATYAGLPLTELILVESCFAGTSQRKYFRLAAVLNIPYTALGLSLARVEQEIELSGDYAFPESGRAVPEQAQSLILVVGHYFSGLARPVDYITAPQQNIEIRQVATGNQSFSYLGVGTAAFTTHPVPECIILDTEIRGESCRQTTRALQSVERLRRTPVFLTGADPTPALTRVSNEMNIYGHLVRPTSKAACTSQIRSLLEKVERLHAYM